MGVKAELAFGVCWDVYRSSREVLEAKRGPSAVSAENSAKYLWHPNFRPRMNEFVADFALAGKAALDSPDLASRAVLFRLYYVGLMPYDQTRHFLGISEMNWVQWTEEIRRRAGKEMLRRGMFPPPLLQGIGGVSHCNGVRHDRTNPPAHCGQG
jgi:hypothetical protein